MEHNLLHMLAKELQRLAESFLKEVQRRLQACASMPDGPAAPSVQSTIVRMREPVMRSKMTG